MIEASCHCGAVRLDIDTAPAEVTDCNCSLCRRYGVLWAYYSPSEVTLRSTRTTSTYRWGKASIDFHRCATCGCVTHWSALDPQRDRMGINARMMDPDVWRGAKRRRLDGAASRTYIDQDGSV